MLNIIFIVLCYIFWKTIVWKVKFCLYYYTMSKSDVLQPTDSTLLSRIVSWLRASIDPAIVLSNVYAVINFCGSMWSFEWKRITNAFYLLFMYCYWRSRGECWVPINLFNTATCLRLSEASAWMSKVICRGPFNVQWVMVRGDRSFCWYWWDCWPSLFTFFLWQ
jgi:hypothetical protein